jgi:CheY-like chemotaxis protein
MRIKMPSAETVVLLVEDEALVRMVLAEFFEDLRFEVIECESAEDAPRLLQTQCLPEANLSQSLIISTSSRRKSAHW